MTDATTSLVQFLAILNPFALCLYLAGTMEDLTLRNFMRVLIGACATALLVFAVFAIAGEWVLVSLLGIRVAALRAFGGVIFFIVGYKYTTKGYKTAVVLRGSLEELPAAIALPFMIGAGTITQSVLIGRTHTHLSSVGILSAGIVICFAAVVAFKLLRDWMTRTSEKVFDRYVNTLARINGLLIGAISTEMILSGAQTLLRPA